MAGCSGLLNFLIATLLLLSAGTARADRIVYIHTDAFGSPIAETDEDGRVIWRATYDPYGNVVNGNAQDGPGYTGHVADASTGFVYAQQRYYDPTVGNFISPDPVAALDDPVTGFNRYRYGNSNPYRFNDPDGRRSIQFSGISCLSRPQCTNALDGEGQSKWAEVKSRLGLSGDLTKNGNILDFGALAHDIAIPVMNSPGGAGAAAVPKLGVLVKAQFDFARAGHVFRNSTGHVNPSKMASKLRYARLFEDVASNPANLRPDAVAAGLITQQAASSGVTAYTQTMRNGSQVWVHMRNGRVQNAGVNLVGEAR